MGSGYSLLKKRITMFARRKQKTDLSEQVILTLGTWADEFDIPGIVDELMCTYDHLSIDTISDSQFWTTAHKYDKFPENRAA